MFLGISFENKTAGRLIRLAVAVAAAAVAAAALTLSASAIYVIDNMDQPEGWSGTCSPEKDIVCEGDGALRIDSADYGDGGILCLAQKQIKTTDLSEYADGYIRFYLYVENEDNLGDASQFELTSSGTCDVEELSCNINTLDLHSGWNELIFSVAELSGAVRLDKVNFIRLYMFQTGEQTLVLDDICVGSAADFGIGEVAVKEKTVLPLDNCDSAAGYTDGGGNAPAVYTGLKIEGSGAVGAEADGTLVLTKTFGEQFDISEYVKSGYIYFWLYIDSADALEGSASLAVRSSDKDMVAWSLTGLVKGWNEVLLKLSDSNIGSGAIDFAKLSSFTVSIGNNGSNLLIIDNILYGYSRDFGIKSADDPPLEGTAVQTDTPVKATSANSVIYMSVTVLTVVIIVSAAAPLAARAVKSKKGRVPSAGDNCGGAQ